MTGTRRLVDFGVVCISGLIIWVIAERLWPYLGLVAPVGALIALLLGVNLVDGLWFAVRHRPRPSRESAAQRPSVGIRPAA